MDKANPVTNHPVSELRNFSRFLSTGDLQHCGPLGILGFFLGAVLWELVFDGVFEGSEANRLDAVWHQILMEYELQDSKDRLGALHLSMFSTGVRRSRA